MVDYEYIGCLQKSQAVFSSSIDYTPDLCVRSGNRICHHGTYGDVGSNEIEAETSPKYNGLGMMF